jgi:hypothetical protein
MMNWFSRVDRAKNLIFDSERTWGVIFDENAPPAGVFMEYVLPMAAVPSIAHLLGFWYYGLFSTIFRAVLWFLLAVSGVWLTGKMIYYSATHFNSVPNEARSFQLAAYSFTPFFMAGAVYILPFLSAFVFLGGLYGIRLLHRGLPRLMETSAEKNSAFTLAAGAAMILVMWIVGQWTGGIFWPSKP